MIRDIVVLASISLLLMGHASPSQASTKVTETAKPTTALSLTATPDACPGTENQIAAQLGENFSSLIENIALYLEQGKPVSEIPITFSKNSDNYFMNFKVGVLVVNLAKLGSRDIVITIQQGDWLSGSSGVFVFRRCSTGKYTAHYISAEPESNARLEFSRVQVIPVWLLAKNSAQLLVRYGEVLSGRCLAETFLVIGLENNTWATYLKDGIGCDAGDIANVSKVLVREPDSDGRRGLVVLGTRWTGWGIYQFASREVRLTYGWQGNELQFVKRDFRPSAYRFHALEDAQLALDAGKLTTALAKYQTAATDLSLKDAPSWFEFESLPINLNDPENVRAVAQIAHQYQTAFASFRIVVLSAELGQNELLQKTVKQMVAFYPDDQPGHELVELAVIFQEAFGASGNSQQACARVNPLVESKYPNLTGPNGHIGNWGEQGEFTIEVICP